MEATFDTLWLLPALPLLGWLVNTVLASRMGRLAGWLATALVAASFGLALAGLLTLLGMDAADRTVIWSGPEWITSGDLRFAFDLRLDALSATLALVVTGVGALIHLYSIGYMAGDARRATFFAWLNLFVASMLTLVLAQNLLVMFLGWEGVGLCSYLLIGFWSGRDEVPAAAKKAFIANRIGDVGFLLAMFLLIGDVGSLDLDAVLGSAAGLGAGVATAVALLLFLACAGKSAQIPLYVWLPDAMAGPTPVSALIHAATMVTAGVFLVARLHPVFEAAPAAQTVVVVVGAVTALLAAVIAIGQDDIKRILAYSTVSQLGYMFIGVGLGPVGLAAGIFHLVTHAFFKAQLFLGAGAVMHSSDGEVDLTRLGGLRRALPLTFWTTMAAWLAIIGFPLTAGYFSKDQILESALAAGGVGALAYALGLLTAVLTAFYMSRLVFLTFFGEPRWPAGRHPHEAGPVMTVPLVLLGLASLGGGAVLGWAHGSGPIYAFLEPLLGGEEAVGSPVALVTVPALAAMVAGVAFAWYLYLRPGADWLALRQRLAAPRRVLAERLYVDHVYEFFTVTLGRAAASFLAVFVDQRAIDGAVNGTAQLVGSGARSARRLQSGLVRTYAVGVLGGAVLVVAFLVYRSL